MQVSPLLDVDPGVEDAERRIGQPTVKSQESKYVAQEANAAVQLTGKVPYFGEYLLK